MENKGLNIIKGITLGALSLSLVAPSAMAGSTTVRLYTSQEKAWSDVLGNTTGKYKVSGITYEDSENEIEEYLYIGATADHCGITKDHWINRPSSKPFSPRMYSVSKDQYTVARTTLYSYRKNNMQKKCRGYATLSNAN